jgi:hypothetical protein
MHIIKNFFEKLTFKLFAGNRAPTWSTAKNPEPDKNDAEYDTKMANYEDARARWELAVAQAGKCTFSKADQELVDRRVKNLVGPANWIKNSMVQLITSHAIVLLAHACFYIRYPIYVTCIHICIHANILVIRHNATCTRLFNMHDNMYTYMHLVYKYVYILHLTWVTCIQICNIYTNMYT